MKKIVALTVMGVMATLLVLKATNQSTPVVSQMSIIIDYDEPIFKDTTAVLEEALKTIDSQCSNIFLNKQLWLKCIADLDEQIFNQQWNFYDTKQGLLYIQAKDTDNSLCINIETFAHIENPFDLKVINATQDGQWYQTFATLFDLNACRKNHNHAQSKIAVYMNGHGMPRSTPTDQLLACGINYKQFAQLLKLFNDELPVTLLGVQSCYWTTARIAELMLNEYNLETLKFTVLTPLSIEKSLWLDSVGNYLQKGDERFCFFDCCVDMTQTFTHNVTDEIKDIVYSTDTLQLQQNNMQKATLVAAGSNTLVII